MLKPMNNNFGLNLATSIRSDLRHYAQSSDPKSLSCVDLLASQSPEEDFYWGSDLTDLRFVAGMVDIHDHDNPHTKALCVDVRNVGISMYMQPICEVQFTPGPGFSESAVIKEIQEYLDSKPVRYHMSWDGDSLILGNVALASRHERGEVKVHNGSAYREDTGEFLGKALANLSDIGMSERVAKDIIAAGKKAREYLVSSPRHHCAPGHELERYTAYSVRMAWSPESGVAEQLLVESLGGPAWINKPDTHKLERVIAPRRSAAVSQSMSM